jgi:hypothetical protein
MPIPRKSSRLVSRVRGLAELAEACFDEDSAPDIPVFRGKKPQAHRDNKHQCGGENGLLPEQVDNQRSTQCADSGPCESSEGVRAVKLGEQATLSLFLKVCALDIDADIAEPERRPAYQGTHDHDRKRSGNHASAHDDH